VNVKLSDGAVATDAMDLCFNFISVDGTVDTDAMV
jgi:hypothetical protein